MPASPGVRPEPLQAFVDELVRLRAAAGNPSFRRMAATSGAVSHATLHQAVTGHRLQPWETVREFVRACDGDEDAFHEQWRRTQVALAEPAAATGDEPATGGERRGGLLLGRRFGLGAVAALTATAIALTALVAVALHASSDASRDDLTGTSGRPSPSVSAPLAATPGDAARLVRDVTYRDGAVVRPGASFVKVWEMQNLGTVPWRGRYLHRVDPQRRGGCRTPERVRIDDTEPRKTVRISVRVTAPRKAPVTCKVRWKIVDAAGRQQFPASRPVYFLVRVRG